MSESRLLWRGQTIEEVRAKARHPAVAPFYQGMVKQCRALVTKPPVLPPPSPSTSMDRSPGELGRTRWGQRRIVSLALAYLLEGDAAFKERAWTEIECWLDQWNSWTDPYHGPATHYDLMTGEMGLTMGLAYDWLRDLEPGRRAKLREHLGRRVIDLYLENTNPPKPVWWFRKYNNWNAVCNGGAVVAALALEGEHPRASEVIKRANRSWLKYFDSLGEEGGWDEGTGYWQYGMRYGLMALAALGERGHADGGILRRRGMRLTARFPISFCPGEVAVSWGDSASKPRDALFYLFADIYRDPDFVRYLDRSADTRAGDWKGWPSKAFAVLWRPVGERWVPRPGSRLSMKTARIYEEIGWCVFVDDWEKPGFVAGFKCGDLGASHTQLDNNTFQIWAGGNWLALDHGGGVYNRDYFSEKRWGMYVVSTAGHNGLLIGGKGQSPRTKGTLQQVRSARGLDVVVGDASKCYGKGVALARRHFAVVDRSYVVVIDEVRAETGKTIEWLLHTEGSIAIAGGRADVRSGASRMRVMFPEERVKLKVSRDPDELPPGKKETVLKAESTMSATGHLLPVVLLPGRAGKRRVEFRKAGNDLEVIVIAPYGGRDVLVWRKKRGMLEFQSFRRRRAGK